MSKEWLLIDDDGGWGNNTVFVLNDMVGEDIEVVFVPCGSIEEATQAIRKHQDAEVLFLDHSLTRGGAEGKQIAIFAQQFRPLLRIFSTSALLEEEDERWYNEQGIPCVPKMELERFVEEEIL